MIKVKISIQIYIKALNFHTHLREKYIFDAYFMKERDIMASNNYFTEEEKNTFLNSYRELCRCTRNVSTQEDFTHIRKLISEAVKTGHYQRDKHGLNPALRNINTALILAQKVGYERSMLVSVLVYNLVVSEFMSIEEIEKEFGEDITKIIRGLMKAKSLYAKQAAVESDNFRKLLLTFAEDVRVIIIMIADRLCVMRMINHHPNEKFRYDVACEASYLYAPLSHRLGLYGIKSELEDLSLKYTNRETFSKIAHELNATKRERDRFIADFIAPIQKKLEEAGLSFEIKGRTKSIFSIWNKMKKQKAELKDIYDLFCHPRSAGYSYGTRKSRMLASIFHYYGYVSAKSKTSERLAFHP